MKKPNLILSILVSLPGCVPSGGVGNLLSKLDPLRTKSSGSEITRSTDPNDCSKVSPHAQNFFLEWGRNRISDGKPASVGTISALMGLARFESGGGSGANFANVTSHDNETQTNREGWNGSSFGSTSAVERFLDRYRPSHETNFGALQISPNVIVNYNQQSAFLEYVNRFSDPSELYVSCMTDMAYIDKANALRNITDLHTKRDQLKSWFQTLSNYTASGQAACRLSQSCTTAAAEVGRWLAYCPRLNMDLAAVVYEQKPAYFGARKHYPGQNPQVCRDMIALEMSRNPNDTTLRIAEKNPAKDRSPASTNHSDSQPI